MPPLVLELGVALALITALVKTTTAISRIEYQQKMGHIELLGKHETLNNKLDFIEREGLELKNEIKELRRRRKSDPDTKFN